MKNFILSRVPYNISIFHGSPITKLKTVEARVAYSYKEYGKVVFGSPKLSFASCFGFKWHDDIAKQYTNDSKVNMEFSKKVKETLTDPCSLYELKNDGKWFYLPSHPNEVIHFGDAIVIDEQHYKNALIMMRFNNVNVRIV